MQHDLWNRGRVKLSNLSKASQPVLEEKCVGELQEEQRDREVTSEKTEEVQNVAVTREEKGVQAVC